MATRKVKRYNGMTGSDVASFAGTPENDSNAGMKDAYDSGVEARGDAELVRMRDEAAAAPSNFKEAFAAARGAGDKTFEYNGKKYTTEMAKPASKPAASSAKAETKPETKVDTTTKKSNILEDAKAEARRRAAGASAYKKSQEPTMRAGDMPKRGAGLSAIKMKSGGKVSSASSRGDGIAMRGKTRGKYL